MKKYPQPTSLLRRNFLNTIATSVATISAFRSACRAELVDRKPTVFQHACMTLPYSNFPLQRALTGIKAAGFGHVAWGIRHRESNGEQVPVMAEDASTETAKTLGQRCRDLGLEPVMMFSSIYPEDARAIKVLTQRIKQAAAAGIGQVLTFGHTQGDNRALWIERFKVLGPI
ncbi:MAG TPA: hypothetical protein VM260_07445, partial [Pirellula sp.]|nr:hypothetical protein [Pirellula sp.]